MNADNLKQAWLAQPSRARLTIDADLLLNEVRQNQIALTAMIFWRDLREVGISLVMVPVVLFLGIKCSLPWTWYLVIPALLWIAAFMLVDRAVHKPKTSASAEPICQTAELALAQLEHQIWLLRNVFWWYILPPGIAILAFFAHVAWLFRDGGWLIARVVGGITVVEVLFFAGVYWLNQRAVRAGLEPRRRELQALLASLKNGTGAGGSDAGAAACARDPKNVKWTSLLVIVVILAIPMVFSSRAHGAENRPVKTDNTAGVNDPAVTNLLVGIREKYHVPAIAAALITGKGLVVAGVVGTRKQGTSIAATLEDKWHLGSDTKAMTATLVAKLVEKGQLKWDSTVAEVFPDLAPGFDAEARTITVLQLLSHRSGLRPNPFLLFYAGLDGTKERLRLVKDELRNAPGHKPGTHYEYSNLGYCIAGAIAEKITGKTWEQAMRDEVFKPLGMRSVGFGGTGTPGRLDQPWGHDAQGQPVITNGPGMDNPPVLGPAGRVHCTIQDWARFIADQLRGARAEAALLAAASYQKLHTPLFGGEYALGWLVVEREWGGGTVLNHGGDNTMNCANVWVAPKRDFAVLVCVNQSGKTAFEASDEAVGALIKLHTDGTGRRETGGRKSN